MENKKVPQLRFNIIENEKLKTENWENALASEIFVTVNERNHPELPVLSASQEFGMIFRDEGGMNISHDKENEVTYKKVSPGQFVIHLRSFQGGFAHSKIEGITSPAYTVLDFKDKSKHSDLFWKYIFLSEEFIKRLELITYGIRDGRSINFSDFSTLNFQFPIREEQQKIGTMLSNIDSLIQAKTQKLECLKSVKKSLLQKCFPRDGEKVPEMRFEGFSGEWEEKKLGEECEIIAGGDVNNLKLKKDGKYPVIANSITTDGILGYYDFDYRVEAPAITVTGRGDVGFAKTRKQNFTPVVRLLALKTKNDVDFLSNAINLQRVIIESTGVPQLTVPQLADYRIKFSTLAEQQKIGQFFSKYDSLISLQQKEIDNLKTIKKSLLQKMFI